MTETIETRRSEAEAKLGKLRSQRGVATLDGKKFDASEIDALEHEVDALGEAAGEQTRREREEAQQEFTQRRAEMRKELAKLEDVRLRAVQDANLSCRKLAESIGQIIDTTRQEAEVAHAITGGAAPIPLQQPDIISRIVGRLSAVMSSIPGHRNRLGNIVWRGASLYSHADDWRQCEATLLEPHLKQLLKETENDK